MLSITNSPVVRDSIEKLGSLEQFLVVVSPLRLIPGTLVDAR